MVASRAFSAVRLQLNVAPHKGGLPQTYTTGTRPYKCQFQRRSSRKFSSSAYRYRQERDSFGTRLRESLKQTKIKWYPIPVGLGIGFLGLLQAYRVKEREKARQEEENNAASLNFDGPGSSSEGRDAEGRPEKRRRIRPTGPWYDLMMAELWLIILTSIVGKFRLCLRFP